MKNLVLAKVNPAHFPEVTPISDDQMTIVLAANVEQSITIPVDSRYVIFNADRDFYVTYDSETVVVPSDTPGQYTTTTEFNPGQRFIADKITIKIMSESLAHVHLSFFA